MDVDVRACVVCACFCVCTKRSALATSMSILLRRQLNGERPYAFPGIMCLDAASRRERELFEKAASWEEYTASVMLETASIRIKRLGSV